MRAFVSGLLLVLLIGVASAFFRPAQPHQEVGAINVQFMASGLDNPGEFRSFQVALLLSDTRFSHAHLYSLLYKQPLRTTRTSVLPASVDSAWDEPGKQTA